MHAPCISSTESQPLDHQGIPLFLPLKNEEKGTQGKISIFLSLQDKKKKKDKKERERDNDSLPPGPDRVVSLSDTLSRRHGLCKRWPAGGLPSSHDSDV